MCALPVKAGRCVKRVVADDCTGAPGLVMPGAGVGDAMHTFDYMAISVLIALALSVGVLLYLRRKM